MRNLKNEAAIFALLLLAMQSVFADFVHLDDVIIDGSACVGFDCVNNESFGFDTLRVKENNLRVHFDDTSTTASFPRNDWRIVINDSANGGANYYAIEDATAGRQPFRIEAGARANALYVSNNGRVGFGTSTPVVDAHVVSGNTPTLRLEQDGTSGFTPQTWDVAGNEANFFIRDATNESRLPFRIFPGGPTDTLTLSGDGDVGIGTDSPDASLHILRTSGTPSIILETTNSNPEVQWEIKANESTGRLTIKELNGGATPFKFAHNAAENLLRVGVVDPGAISVRGDLVVESANGGTLWDVSVNNATGRLTIKDRNGSTTPLKFAPDAANNLLRVGVLATNTVDINGDLVVTGNCTEQNGACADYVFEPDYELRSLGRLADFIVDNRHLPNVPSAKEIEDNGVNMAQMTGRLLEKIEELTLYTLQQQETIEQLNARLAKVEQSAN